MACGRFCCTRRCLRVVACCCHCQLPDLRTTAMDDGQNMTKAHCNRCGHKTNHDVLHSERTEGSEMIDDEQAFKFDWWDRYEMLRCRGCERVTLRHTSYFS